MALTNSTATRIARMRRIQPSPVRLDSPHPRNPRRCWILGLTLLCATSLRAQSVLPDDPVYSLIDRLIAARVIAPVTISQRPLSQERVRSILDEALSHIAAADSSILARQTRLARRTFAPLDSSRKRITMDRLDADARAAHSPTRGIVPDGNGAIEVDLNPLLGNRLGIRPLDGAQYGSRVAAAYRFDRHFNLTFGFSEIGRASCRERGGILGGG